MKVIGIMEVGSFRLGHARDEVGATGCTVILPSGSYRKIMKGFDSWYISELNIS